MTERPVVDPRAIRRALREAGVRARHSLSQNFLADADVLDAVLVEAAPTAGTRILEIGPGLGILTGALIDAGAVVTAIELDGALAARLAAERAGSVSLGERDPDAAGALRIVVGDALDVDLDALVEPPFDVVANIPYHITSPILHRLLGGTVRPRRLVLMVQREVAERIAAPPGRMSYLSVFVQHHAAARVAATVPPTAFEPEPAVDSAILVLDVTRPGRRSPAEVAAEDGLWRVVQAGFRERRKMLHNVLTRQLPIPPERIVTALAATGIDGERRPQTLSVAEWVALRDALGPIG
ncbi:MAG TPA: 16S rRNA (adenine(1518)-N(6)/adenine(1519)-N(6))-dimethyltransferase RsmA [Candidatus Limnocylindrales bacterium]|nr:16S rRNA (adenine(1518)-N(6)/adenine(1519)-N(6))-dimethyltransferase RsmA [Candidatus Limnocylindrales bacterium]